MERKKIKELHESAHALAKAMAPIVDANEVGKVLAFFVRWKDPRKAFILLKRLPESGLVRTGRTRGYFQAMARAFDQHLKDIPAEEFGYILGWSFRLMRYYQINNGPSSKQSSKKPYKKR